MRVLDNNKVVRIGGTYERDLDVRVISATNRNLLYEITKGSFRQDLYFRLNVINLRIPPLRKRVEDIVELARYFLKDLNEENDGLNKKFSSEFEKLLKEQEWSGNVRELKNVIQRAYYMSDKEVINSVQLNKDKLKLDMKNDSNVSSGITMKDIEKESIVQALYINKGNAQRAAKDLNISKATIYRKIKAYSIDTNNTERMA